MIHCFIDLEFNLSDSNISAKNRVMECVSIGACFLDENNKVEKFYSVIKPKNNIILGKRFQEITKLKQSDINNARSFTQVIDEFVEKCNKYKNIKFYTWGPEDKRILLSDVELNEYNINKAYFINKIIDFQKIVSSSILYKGNILRKQWSLKDMQMLYRNKEYTTHHNALTDAIMLKDIFIAFNSKKELNHEYLKKFIDVKIIEEKQRKEAFNKAKETYFSSNKVKTYLGNKQHLLLNKQFLKKYKIDKKFYNSNKIVVACNNDKIDIFYVINNDTISHLALILNVYNFSSIKRYLNNLDKVQTFA